MNITKEVSTDNESTRIEVSERYNVDNTYINNSTSVYASACEDGRIYISVNRHDYTSVNDEPIVCRASKLFDGFLSPEVASSIVAALLAEIDTAKFKKEL